MPPLTPLQQFWTIFFQRPRIVVLLLITILTLGWFSFTSIPRESTPTIEIPSAVVTTLWPGAGASDTEALVTDVLERQIDGLQNLSKYTSVSSAGMSVITVEFTSGSDLGQNMNKLRERIDSATRDLPATLADDPSVTEVSISDMPIISMTLSGDLSWSELRRYATALQDEYERVPQVKRVSLSGAPEPLYQILLSPQALQAHHLTVEGIIQTLQAQDRDIPLGVVTAEGEQVQVSIQGKFKTIEDIQDVVVSGSGVTQVRLSDIATVREGFADFSSRTYFLPADGQLQHSVSLSVIKSASQGNVLLMVEEVLRRTEQLRETGALPPTVTVNVTYNRADDIRDSLDTLTSSGGQTLLLIALVMLLALGLRESLLASLSIPLAMLMAITYLFFTGQTFNGVSLFALVLGIGLLVDNAIIVVEGIYDARYHQGMSRLDAAIYTIQTFSSPILTGTLTTICAFWPMMWFISGVSGDYVSVIPITVMAVLIAALLVSLMLIPVVALWVYPDRAHMHQQPTLWQRLQRLWKKNAEPSPTAAATPKPGIKEWYERQMQWVLARGRRAGVILLASVGVFVFSVSLLVSNAVPVEVFPPSDFSYFAAQVEVPEGSTEATVEGLLPSILAAVEPYFAPQTERNEPWLESITVTVGSASSLVQGDGGSGGGHLLGLTFQLSPTEDRETSSVTIAPLIEQAIRPVLPSWASFRIIEEMAGPPSGAPIELRITGDKAQRLRAITQQVRERLSTIPELLNLRDTLTAQTLLQEWEFDEERLRYFGLNPSQIAQTLRSRINGVTVAQITQGGEEYDVSLRVSDRPVWEKPSSLSAIESVPLMSPRGEVLSLSDIARPTLTTEDSLHTHRDGDSVLYVRADLPTGVTASMLEDTVLQAVSDIELLPTEHLTMGGEAEEGNRLIQEMMLAMGTAAMLILLVLVWQFGSLHQSFITLSLIPFSLTGVFIGFWLTGRTITFPTMIGIVSLAGIIVNDAIVLIDRYNEIRKTSDDLTSALIHAGSERLQPIFLTSLTTVVGMLPLSLSDEVWGGLGFAIVYGMVLSTLLCLLLAPCMLFLYDRAVQRRRSARQGPKTA